MKKALALLLVLVLCLCACGKEPYDPVKNPSSEGESETVSEEEPEEEPEEEIVPKRGTVENYVYRNGVFGVTFTANENWYFCSDEEVAEIMGIAIDQMLNEEYSEAYEDLEVVYDMYAMNMSTGQSTIINYENVGLIYGTILTEDYYLKLVKSHLEEQFSEVFSVTVIKCEITSDTLDGEELPCLYMETDYGTHIAYQKYFAKKVGTWIGSVTLSAPSTEALEELESMLSFN